MALTEQERRCVHLACASLAARLGGEWLPTSGATLDDLHPEVPSPEVIVSNGERTAAIEVKRVSHAAFDALGSYREYLMRRLAPEVGHFYLMPPFGFELPIDQPLIRRLQREIRRVGPGLTPGETGYLRYERQAHVSLTRADGEGHLWCCHNISGDEVFRHSSSITGVFMLVDADSYEHSFFTDEARRAFGASLREACERRAASGHGALTWCEEWQLLRLDDDDEPSTVEVMAVAVIDVRESVEAAVSRLVDAALVKFEQRRWADFHVLVLDKADGILDSGRIEEVCGNLDFGEPSGIDLVIWADGDMGSDMRMSSALTGAG